MHNIQQPSQFTYWKRPWYKWCVFIAALLQLLSLWMNIQEYNEVFNAGVLSAAEWESYASQKIWQCTINGVLAVCLLGTFLIGTFARSRKEAQLIEGLVLLVLALVSGGATCVCYLLSLSGRWLFWLLILLVALGGAVHSFWKYHRE